MSEIKNDVVHTSLPLITGFFITNLFGLYTYDVSLPKASDERGERIILIYGDNGSGKTTIVNLIYHLLSPSARRGHRSYLAKTRFDNFGVYFSDNRSLIVSKESEDGLGAYLLQLKRGDEVLSEVRVDSEIREGEFVVSDANIDNSALRNLFYELFPTKLECFYLSDNRELSSDHVSGNVDKEIFPVGLQEQLALVGRRRWLAGESDVDQPTRQLQQSVARAESWIKDQTLEARSANDESVSGIYKDLIVRLGAYGSSQREDNSRVRAGLIERLTRLAASTKKLSQLGLASDVPIDDFVSVIGKADDQNMLLIDQVLTPYFDSVQARIDGLKDVAKRLGTFVNVMNNFYHNKELKIDALHGLNIKSSKGDKISVESLSSGEKHLLTLMCNILVGTSQRSLFLVDEPELSLNVKWQRTLVDALLDLSSGSPVQFFMATHSIELLADHKKSTLRLTNLV